MMNWLPIPHAYPLRSDIWLWSSIPATFFYLIGTQRLGRWVHSFYDPQTTLPWTLGLDNVLALGVISAFLILIGRFTTGLPWASAGIGGLMIALGLYASCAQCTCSKKNSIPLTGETKVLLGLIFVSFLILLFASLCPPTKSDEIAYHLPFIERTLLDGRFNRYPGPFPALQPLAVEVFALPLVFLGFSGGPAVLSLAGLLLLSLVLIQEGHRLSPNVSIGVLEAAAVLFLLTPWAVVWGIAPGNDTWSTLALTLATLFALETLEDPRCFFPFALCSTVAVLSKSIAMVPVGVLGLGIALLLLKKKEWRLLRLSLLGSLMLALPFALRTWADWGVFFPDPLVFLSSMRHFPSAETKYLFEVSIYMNEAWPRSLLGLLQLPKIFLTPLGWTNLQVGPLLIVCLWKYGKRLTRGSGALIGGTLAGCLLALTYLLPQHLRFYGGVLLGLGFMAWKKGFSVDPMSDRWMVRGAIIYLLIIMGGLTPYLTPFVRQTLTPADPFAFLEPRTEAALARKWTLSHPKAGASILTNMRELTYLNARAQSTEGDLVFERSITTFRDAKELGETLKSAGYTRLLWANEGTPLWEDLFRTFGEIRYDQPQDIIDGSRWKAPLLRGRVRVIDLK